MCFNFSIVTEDLDKRGELVIREEPLFVVPHQSQNLVIHALQLIQPCV